MKSLKNIRSKTGLSQQALSIFLKTAKSNIAMAERGQRPLSSKALLRISEIEKYLNDPSFQEAVKKRGDLPATGLAFYIDRCRALIVTHAFNIKCLQAKLLRMETEYNEGIHCMELFNQFGINSLRENECVNRERLIAQKKIQFGDPLLREKMRHKIYMAQCDHTYLTQYLEDNKTCL